MSSSLEQPKSDRLPHDSSAEAEESMDQIDPGDLVEVSIEDVEDAGDSTNVGSRKKFRDPTFHWMMLGLCVAVLLLSSLLSVRERTQVLVPLLGRPLPELCHFKKYTGIDCPGCGLTRSFISIAHGRLREAWRYNPGAFVLFPIMLFQIPFRATQLWRLKRGLPELALGWVGRFAMGSVVCVLLGQWVLRQLGVAI
jgi:hypothetical protein